MGSCDYAYIASAYGVQFTPGERVQHSETHRVGTVAPVNASSLHRVSVKFDGDRRPRQCHPLALDKVDLGLQTTDSTDGR